MNIKVLLSLLTLLCILSTANAQQAQPTNIVQGIRVPQLDTSQRGSIILKDDSDTIKNLAKGQAIYNISNDCFEYWNGTGWVSLCPGDDITIRNACQSDYQYSQPPLFTANGISVVFSHTYPVARLLDSCSRSFTPVTDYVCNKTLSADSFNVYITVGASYAKIVRNGNKFSVKFDTNYSELDRTAIVRVVNYCSDENRDFPFIQKGITCEDYPPMIISASDSALCTHNLCSAYVTLTAKNICPFDNTDLRWVRNGVAPGKYVNNYPLILKQGATDTGEWYLSQGTRRSNTIRIKGIQPVDAMPTDLLGSLSINGLKIINNSFFCARQATEFKVDSAANYPEGTVFTWSLSEPNKYSIGSTTDSILIWNPPDTMNFDVDNIQGQTSLNFYVTLPSKGCYTRYTYGGNRGNIEIYSPPPTPVINNGNAGTNCSGNQMLLNATKPDGSAYSNPWTNEPYEWFFNGKKIENSPSASIVAAGNGSYTVRFSELHTVLSGYIYTHCTSEISKPFVVKRSGAPMVEWLKTPADSVYQGDDKMYAVIAAPDIDSYTWISEDTNIARIITYGNGQNIRVIYTDNAAILPKQVWIVVFVSNACGTAYLPRQFKVVSK